MKIVLEYGIEGDNSCRIGVLKLYMQLAPVSQVTHRNEAILKSVSAGVPPYIYKDLFTA